MPERTRGYHHGDLPETLIATALVLIAEKGPQGFSLAEAARRAGVSTSAPYRHFPDRSALLAAVAGRGYGELGRRIAAAVDDAAPPVDRVSSAAAAYVVFAAEEPAMFATLFTAGLDKGAYPELGVAAVSAFEPLTAASRALTRSEREAMDLSIAVTACAHGHAALLVDDRAGPARAAEAAARAAAAARALVRSRRELSPAR